MKVYMVVGAGYGDEGKGLTVDWLQGECQQQGLQPLVIRYNGGTQAAHTVEYSDGKRLVWHNLNSATARGAPTYLARKFILNPIGLVAELTDPAKARYNPVVYASHECRVSLPVDMQLNQMMETRRSKRHGSCGWGVGETVERSLDPELLVTAADLSSITVETVQALTKAYLAKRLPVLGVGELEPHWRDLIHSEAVMQAFVRDCRIAAAAVTLRAEKEMFQGQQALIFEAAQGLGLSEDAEHFPHVTRSKTGCQWALELLERAKVQNSITRLETIYVTRAYATRHGAGPLEREGCHVGCNVQDPTNVENQWQGALRAAPLDLDVLSGRVCEDLSWALSWHSDTVFSMLMTHCDAATEEYNCYGSPHMATPRTPQSALAYCTAQVRVLAMRAGRNTKGMRAIASLGPRRSDVAVLLEDTKDMVGRAASVLAGL